MADSQTGFIVFDAAGAVVATHLWGDARAPEHCPLDTPPGGRVVRVHSRAVMAEIQADHVAGHHRDLTLRGRQMFRGERPLVEVEEV